MKTITIVLGIIGIGNLIIATMLNVLKQFDVLATNSVLSVEALWFGYLGACICFGSLAIIDAISPNKSKLKLDDAYEKIKNE
jgi:hypothetical protein